MKKLSTYLFLILFSFQTSSWADDISDFQIEGMSIGDSLLDYMSEEEIKKEIKKNRYMYNHLTEEFGEVYIFEGLETYDRISFFVKTDDEKFIIYQIRGSIPYEKDINGCKKKQNEIEEEFSKMFKDAKKRKSSFKHRADPTGRSTVDFVSFKFESGDKILVLCTDFEENLRNKNNWSEGLNVAIDTIEIYNWFYPQ